MSDPIIIIVISVLGTGTFGFLLEWFKRRSDRRAKGEQATQDQRTKEDAAILAEGQTLRQEYRTNYQEEKSENKKLEAALVEKDRLLTEYLIRVSQLNQVEAENMDLRSDRAALLNFTYQLIAILISHKLAPPPFPPLSIFGSEALRPPRIVAMPPPPEKPPTIL